MINMIAAVGQRGELGFQGRIPWRDDDGMAAITDADLGWFAKQTAGGVLVVGGRTWSEMLTMGFRPGDRDVKRWDGRMPVRPFLDEVKRMHRDQEIWICGGGYTYESFMPYVQRFHISLIPWTGQADTYLPPILPVWFDAFQRRVRS